MIKSRLQNEYRIIKQKNIKKYKKYLKCDFESSSIYISKQG